MDSWQSCRRLAALQLLNPGRRIALLIVPRDTLVVFTGVSGSGKSSLAFGTLYAEAQRRYLE